MLSLMVGSAVDRLCVDEVVSQLHLMDNGFGNGTNGTGGTQMGCAFGVASAIAFLGGIFQVYPQ